MSWVKIDDGAPEHPKLLAAGVAACWLWVCGLAYCNRQKRRDGVIPLAKVKLLYPGLGLKQAETLVVEGLWEKTPDGYRVHDYHEYQPDADRTEEIRAIRSAAGRRGGQRSSEARAKQRAAATSNQVAAEANKQTASKPAKQSSTPARPGPAERESPPSPSEPEQPRPDRFMASFLPVSAEVAELHEAWKRTTGKTGHKLRGGTADLDATTLEDAIALHGLADCLAVLTVAKQDGMVNGSTDEKRVKHDSIRYIFGNEQTFARLLQAAQEAAKKSRVMGHGEGALERAMRAQPDTSDVYVPRSPQ